MLDRHGRLAAQDCLMDVLRRRFFMPAEMSKQASSHTQYNKTDAQNKKRLVMRSRPSA